MDTKLIIAMLISFVAGILSGRLSTYYRLFRAQKLVDDSGILLDQVKAIREEIGDYYEKLQREGCDLRENNIE